MKKSLKKNYLYNLSYQILILLLPLITTPYISRILGATNIGIYSYTLSIVTYFTMFGSLGIALYGQREIAYNQDNKLNYSKVFTEIFLLRLITMSISIILFCIFFINKNNDYNIYFTILVFELVATIVDISWFFQGLEEFKKTVLRNLIIKLISVICIFIFVKTKNDLKLYFIIYVLSNFIGNISLWFYLPKYLVKFKIGEINIFRHLRPTISLFIPQIAIQIYTVLDKTMIGTIIVDKSEVGYYDQAQKIIKMLLTLVTSLGIVMLPRIANSHAKGNNEDIINYMKKSFSVSLMISLPLIFGIIVVSDNFVPLFFGDGYSKVSVLMKVISPILLFIGLSNVIGQQFLLPTKKQKEYTISVIIGACINLILNIFLIHKMGALGASIATVLAEFSVTFIQFVFVKDIFKPIDVFKLSFNYLIASLCMFAFCFLIGMCIKNSVICLFLQIIFGCIIYFIIVLILKDNLMIEELLVIKNKLGGLYEKIKSRRN